jgi:hypothetical protein
MKPTLFHPGVLFATSITCSLLLHWAVFANVILIFPLLKDAPKPMIVFLGSILQPTDMANRSEQTQAQTKPADNITKIKDGTPLFTGSVDKPWEQSPGDPAAKRTLKSSYVAQQQSESQAQRPPLSSEDFDIKSTIEPYRPLRLKDND